MMLLLSLALFALSAAAQSTNCTTYTSKYYTGDHCPSVVPALPQTSAVSILQGGDDNSLRVPIPITFHLYGQRYRHVWIAVNGQLSFGPEPLQTPYGTMPLQYASLQNTPVIIPWWTDFVMQESSAITYSTETINDQRVFIIRYQSMEYYQSETVGTADTASFDVVLYEGTEGKVEVKYYAMNLPTVDRQVTIGIQGDDVDADELIVIASQRWFNAEMAAQFTSSTLRYTYSGPDVSTAQCAGLGFNFTSLTDREFVVSNAAGSNFYALRICGIVEDSACQSSANTDRSMLCRRSSSGNSFTSLAEWSPAESYWVYPAASTGVQLVTQSGATCVLNQNRPYITVFNFVCSAEATTPSVVVEEAGSCLHRVNITTNLACGQGDRNVPPTPVASTMTSCANINGVFYDAEHCPRAADSPVAFPQPLVNPEYILATDDGALIVDFGFDFSFYGTARQNVSVNSNGLLTFGPEQTTTGYNGPFPHIGLQAGAFPVIAPFFTDFMNRDTNGGLIPYTGYIAYAYAGTAPNRQLIVRYHKVDYYRGQFSIAEPSASFDVVLSEDNSIEIRYYQIDSVIDVNQNLVVGLVMFNETHTAVVNNQPITRTLAAQMTCSTLRYRLAGTQPAQSSSSSTAPAASSSSPASTTSVPTAAPASSSSAVVPISPSSIPIPIEDIPAGTVRLVMNVELREPVTAANFAEVARRFELDIANNLASALGTTPELLAQYIRVTRLGGVTGSAARRLLQTTTEMEFVILGSVSNVATNLDPAQAANVAAQTVVALVQNEQFETPTAGATVPRQTVTPVVVETPHTSTGTDGINGAASVSQSLLLTVLCAVVALVAAL